MEPSAKAYMVVFADADGAECGKAYTTVGGEIGLEWGYGDSVEKVMLDPADVDAVTRALRMLAGLTS